MSKTMCKGKVSAKEMQKMHDSMTKMQEKMSVVEKNK